MIVISFLPIVLGVILFIWRKKRPINTNFGLINSSKQSAEISALILFWHRLRGSTCHKSLNALYEHLRNKPKRCFRDLKGLKQFRVVSRQFVSGSSRGKGVGARMGFTYAR